MADKLAFRLGGLAAEKDPLLTTCFVRSQTIVKVLNFDYPKNIVIGKKGAGKSAIFLMGQGTNSKIPTVRISPQTHTIEIKKGGLNYLLYADIIKFEIAIECVKTLSGYYKEKLTKQESLRIKTISEQYANKLKELSSRVTNASAFGAGITLSEQTKSVAKLISKQEIDEVIGILKLFASKGAKCLVLIDDPELLFSSTEELFVNPLGGLLFAAADLNLLMPKSLKVIVLLKLHIYHELKRTFEDIDHLRQNFELLRWTENDLEDLLRIRLEKTSTFQSNDTHDPWLTLLGNDKKKSDSDKVKSYLLERLVCGPRDLIWFSSLILEMQTNGYHDWESIKAAEATYSSEQINQLELEYGKRGYKNISNIVTKLFDPENKKLKPVLSNTEFNTYFRHQLANDEMLKQREAHDWLEALTAKTLSELLFDISVLGYSVAHENKFILPYDTNSDRQGFLASNRWRVNPAFYAALNLPVTE